MSSAAALVIGDEILNGKVQDQNSHVLAKMLFERGVLLKRIEVIGDEVEEIVSCVRRLSQHHTYVFTSGGIGPTHDDKTYGAIAKAFERQLRYHQPTVDILAKRLQAKNQGEVLNDARKKMALLPDPCEIIRIENLWVPLVVVENVYVLPGIPELFRFMIEGAKEHFFGPPLSRVLLYTHQSEGDIAEVLELVQERFPHVPIGSYPAVPANGYSVMISCEGRSQDDVQAAALMIEKMLKVFR